MKLITAPQELDWKNWVGTPSVFLAGSIEMGAAEEWQQRVTSALADVNCVVLNPRRKDWDSSWVQSIENEQFRYQVNWELNGLLDHADHYFFYLQPGTKSPITMLELGLSIGLSRKSRHIVVCPDGFWRKGNIDIVCKRYSIPVFTSLDDGIKELKQKLETKNVSIY